MVELECTFDLRSNAVRIEGSNPSWSTLFGSVVELVYVSHSKCELSGFESQLAESGVNELVELPDSESGFNGGSSPSARVFMDKCTSGLCGFLAKEVIGNFP